MLVIVVFGESKKKQTKNGGSKKTVDRNQNQCFPTPAKTSSGINRFSISTKANTKFYS